ncbi:Cd(II)/Pb(II)-responsive transcriptional regulator [Ramlibacter sp. WS9]|uniref:Cd(II)/Pb(II)-responsive transcriptional regulator n=1 Tax=Ramlibacter sp. WS9 TaxID=1882741 RepID=UPI00114183AD|nr:Cd(II)/Pb(II)-responsive transcriptional regulator [Ramlibacter sp. WS9]ROZ78249.1 Cd(II)/Pb(II)-responsive transcriptional regulator [Ramlibacter sp. WS9]
MKIGQLAAATGTQVETIRYYERQGLLSVAGRTDGNYRVYDESHKQRLAFIRHCRCLDMTLDEIRTLLGYKDSPRGNCGEVDELLDEHIGHVTTRIQELKALAKELRALRASCSVGRATAECGILEGLERAAREHDHAAPAGGQRHHVGGSHHERLATRKGHDAAKGPDPVRDR